MRGIKPFKLSFLTRPFSWGHAHHLGVAVIGYFPLSGERTLLSDMEMWMEVPEQLGKDFILDAGIPKSRSEFLLAGFAHQPGGEPAPLRFVRARVGEIEKTLNVVGDRYWVKGVPTEPEPFSVMPLTWGRAYGGEGFEQNPEGKGFHPVEIDGEDVHPLPNVELPGAMVRSPKDRPVPAGFRPIDFVRPSRFRLVGTYDKRWLETRFPGFAEDLDWRVWNVAPEDQWQEEPFVGDERIVLEHLHPTKPKIESQLPGVRARCFVDQRRGDSTELREVDLKLTTVWLLPTIERGIAIFHGAHPIAEDDARDIETIMVAAEHLDRRKPIEHYRDAFARRTGDRAVYEAMNELDLMPEGMDGMGTAVEQGEELGKIEQLRLKRKVEVAGRKIEAVRADLEARGLDPDEHGPAPLEPVPETPAWDEMAEVIEKAQQRMAQAQQESDEARKESAARMEALCEATGMDREMLEAEMTTPPAGPPVFSARGLRDELRALADDVYQKTGQRNDELEFYATDEEYGRMLEDSEKKAKDAYRMGAHYQGAAPPAPENAGAERRAALEAAHARGESLADWDLTGVQLSGIDLRGADLSRTFLESADLSAATLDGARFDDAVLARANLRGASLEGARLARANLGHADFRGARCVGADFREAILEGATLDGVDFEGASLEEVRFAGRMSMKDARFDGANLRAAWFHDVSLDGVDLSGANLSYATFFEVNALGARFVGAVLDDATFFRSSAAEACFVDAHAKTLRVIETSMRGADFKRAVLDEACMRAIDLVGADFSGAKMSRADLSESKLEDAILYRIVAKWSMWVRSDLRRARMISADLFEAILQKADLRGTDLRGANLYATDMSLVRSDDATTVEEAIQDKVRYRPLYEPPPEVPAS